MSPELSAKLDALRKTAQNSYEASLTAIDRATPFLKKVPTHLLEKAAIWYSSLDFEVTHEEKLELFNALALGRWERAANYSNTGFVYTHYVNDHYYIQITSNPPPSCELIDVVEEVPAQPATTRTVKKIICKGQDPEADHLAPPTSNDVSF